MKPINCPLEEGGYKELKSYLRFVNKDDLSYVDMLRPRGQEVEIFLSLLPRADEYTGNWSAFSDKPKKEYHYCILLTPDNISPTCPDGGTVGFFKRRGIFFKASIDLETNKITKAETIPKFDADYVSRALREEDGQWYEYKTSHKYLREDSGGRNFESKMLSKRKISYDKIFI